MSELYRKGVMHLHNPSMGGPNSTRWHDEKSLMTFIRKAVDDGLLVPITEELMTRAEWEARASVDGLVYDWCLDGQCNPDNPDGHMAYPADSGIGWMTMGCRGEGHEVKRVVLVNIEEDS